MKSALLRLREARDSLSATERSIADYLLSHPEEAMELSIHEMAERTFSSPSTMIRMCHRIGFDGYKESPCGDLRDGCAQAERGGGAERDRPLGQH